MPAIAPRSRRTTLPRSSTAVRAAAALLVLGLAAPAAAAAAPVEGSPAPALQPAAGTRDFAFPEPTPVREVYRTILEEFGLIVVFDPHLAPTKLSLRLDGVDALTALDRVATATGTFYKPLDERTIVVAADTVQNRRTYEELIVRTFNLDDADPREVVSLLRKIAGSSLLAVDEDRYTLTLRDNAAKMPIVERLVDIADRRPGEVEVAVEVLEVDRAALAAWLGGGGPRTARKERPAGGPSHRLAPGELAEFESRTAATALARPRLSMIGDSSAEFELNGLPGGDAALRREFEIELGARIHPVTGGNAELTLDFEVAFRRLESARTRRTDQSSPELVVGELSSSVRLASGETYLVTGLGFAGGADPTGPAAPGPAAPTPGATAGGDRAVVVALTPRVVRAPDPIPAALGALRVGTEANLR
jgi:hypothetical protein